MIQRPKKVTKSEQKVQDIKHYQQYAEEQFDNIYDYLTPTVEKYTVKNLRDTLEATVVLIKWGNVVEVKTIIPIPDLQTAHEDMGGLFFVKVIDEKYKPKIFDDGGNTYLRNAQGYIRDGDFRAGGSGDSNQNPNNTYGMVAVYPYNDKTDLQIVYWNLEHLTKTVNDTTLVCYFTYITE